MRNHAVIYITAYSKIKNFYNTLFCCYEQYVWQSPQLMMPNKYGILVSENLTSILQPYNDWKVISQCQPLYTRKQNKQLYRQFRANAVCALCSKRPISYHNSSNDSQPIIYSCSMLLIWASPVFVMTTGNRGITIQVTIFYSKEYFNSYLLFSPKFYNEKFDIIKHF